MLRPSLPYPYSPECVEYEFSEVELHLTRFLGSCSRSCNPSYLSSLINGAGLPLVSRSLQEEDHNEP
jgi:hypothetical protein